MRSIAIFIMRCRMPLHVPLLDDLATDWALHATVSHVYGILMPRQLRLGDKALVTKLAQEVALIFVPVEVRLESGAASALLLADGADIVGPAGFTLQDLLLDLLFELLGAELRLWVLRAAKSAVKVADVLPREPLPT